MMVGLKECSYGYHGYTLIIVLITMLMLPLCMLEFIGANLIPGLMKMSKTLKVRINC
jgi:hypothetical protein